MSTSGYINSDIENGVGTIEFFHPKSNSLPSSLLRSLAQAINDFGSDDKVKVILLKSGGDRAFCAGASFDELLTIESVEQGELFFSGFANVILAIKSAPKFVVACVQGKAVGGGVGIAAAADYCVAVESASIKLSELSIGIGPFIIGEAVERKIGLSAFSNLTINTKEWKTATWAKSNGLFMEVFESVSFMEVFISSFLTDLAKYSPEAMFEIKQMLWKGTDGWEEEMKSRAAQSGKLVLSDVTRKTLSAFKSK